MCLNAHIEVSSGNKEYLNDFILFDCENIMHGNIQVPELKEVAWVPEYDDTEKTILIKFQKNTIVKSIVLYQNIAVEDRVEKISISVGDEENKYNLANISKNYIKINNVKTKMIKIKILKSSGKRAGFSEIEIFDKDRDKLLLTNSQSNKMINKLYRITNSITLEKDIFIARVINKIKRTFTNF